MDTEKISDRFNNIALKYDEQRKWFIPCFDDFYGTTTEFLYSLRSNFKSILDLGAGTGLVSKYLFEKYPDANYTLIDVSDQMLEVAKQRFQNLKNFEYIVSDYSADIPSKKFDLIASALSIHHLDETAKTKLYSMIYNNLDNNGIFLNLDQFNASDDLINKSYNEYWYNNIRMNPELNKESDAWLKRRELDRENTIDETKKLLASAGFRICECIYQYMKFGAVIAIK